MSLQNWTTRRVNAVGDRAEVARRGEEAMPHGAPKRRLSRSTPVQALTLSDHAPLILGATNPETHCLLPFPTSAWKRRAYLSNIPPCAPRISRTSGPKTARNAYPEVSCEISCDTTTHEGACSYALGWKGTPSPPKEAITRCTHPFWNVERHMSIFVGCKMSNEGCKVVYKGQCTRYAHMTSLIASLKTKRAWRLKKI
ncbi:hypothetical protein P171DRAFT_86135 [Karstenula rhodostoma CBS 690.94]|uniref:Uncharacterized protein n=1 Tax=Karstenula rhodostoma CBS 690.94 TaxID=1392251 RepID=A0A9P4U9E1_9PLEO|nr:hypothetical protein P171DRAFT_86135 [Karstenula rhodostoma CBS 690.94]